MRNLNVRKAASVAASLALALSIAACGNSANEAPADVAEATAEEAATEETADYTYDRIGEWDVENPMFGGTMRAVMATMGTEGMDFDAFVNSELGEFSVASFDLAAIGDITSEDVAAYWAELGMVHEAHDADDAEKQWTSIVPDDYDASKAYPLLFCWHGNDNPILMAEGYGVGQAAAERDWIVVFPWASNDDIHLDEFDRILAYMTENYNIDATRIYTTGFSKGGSTSANLARSKSDVLAAAAPCGISAAVNSTLEGALAYGLEGTDPSDYEPIPIQIFGGELDVFGAMPYNDEFKVDGINNYLSKFGIEGHEQTLEASLALIESSENEVEKAIGLTFDETETVALDGTTYHIGRYLDADGNVCLQVVECDGAIHWPTPSMGELVCSFLENYSK